MQVTDEMQTLRGLAAAACTDLLARRRPNRTLCTVSGAERVSLYGRNADCLE